MINVLGVLFSLDEVCIHRLLNLKSLCVLEHTYIQYNHNISRNRVIKWPELEILNATSTSYWWCYLWYQV